MNAHAPRKESTRHHARTDASRQPERGGWRPKAKQPPQGPFVNGRPDAIALQRYQAMADLSPRVQRLADFHAMANNSPKVRALARQRARIDTGPNEVAQRERLPSRLGNAVQRERGQEDEALLQGRFEPLQRQGLGEEEPVQGTFEAIQRQGLEEDDEVQKKQAPSAKIQSQSEAAVPKSNTGLPDGLKSGIESLSGMSMDHVNVHYNSAQPAQVNALAYAQGHDIHVAPGQERHLPHEAWHVVQQAQGRVTPTMQLKDGVPINDDRGLEHEADVMGARAMQEGLAGPEQTAQRFAAGALRRRPGGEPQSPTSLIQRRIGFEFETGIPIAEQVLGPAYQGLNNDDLEAPFPGGKLMVDHLPGHVQSPLENYAAWNIIEFVTDPIADNMSETNFRNTATTWITNLQGVEAYAHGNHAPVQNAPNVGVPGSGLNVHIGIPALGDHNAHWDRFSPQATMGIKLKKIGSILENDTQAGGYGGHVRHDRVALGAQPSNATANLIMDDIHAAYPKKFHTHRQGYGELQGLMVLICNYILTGAANAGRGGYLKNHTALMYKTMLSSVRNDIIGKSYVAAMLGTPARRNAIRGFILNQTGRVVGDEVFPGLLFGGNPVLVGAWVNSVLAGGTDLVFLGMKNPWSNEIGPENVRGKSGAIVEMRDTSDFGMSALGIAGLHDTATIVDYLAQIYMTNKRFAK